MGHIVFRRDGEADEYRNAGKTAKKGLSMVIEGLDRNNAEMVMEGAKKAWKGVKRMCDISEEMEDKYSERRSLMTRDHDDWNERDDEWMERRMRDSMGRFM